MTIYSSRTKLIKTLPKPIPTEVHSIKKPTPYSRDQDDPRDRTPSKVGSSQSEASDPSLDSRDHDGLRERLLSKVRSKKPTRGGRFDATLHSA